MEQLEMITDMFKMQMDLNTLVSGDAWLVDDNPWHTSIWTEAAEMMEETGWAWWKGKPFNLERIKAELIDVWHFMMTIKLRKSLKLRGVLEPEVCATEFCMMYETVQKDPSAFKLQQLIEDLAVGSLVLKDVNYACLSKILVCLEMPLSELHLRYVGKNILNVFRQLNGYKGGEYNKVWPNGVEDNEALRRIITEVDDSGNIKNQLMSGLIDAYKQACAGV